MNPPAPDLYSAAEARTLGAAGTALARAAYDQLERGLHPLPDKPEETTASALRALWLLAADERCSAAGALVATLPPLTADQQERLFSLVQSRLAGVPLAHLTERQRFMGLDMLAGPAALIPRRETEIVARAAVDLATQVAEARGAVLVLDACTGSGNLAAAVAAAEPRASVLATDISGDAIALARRNFEHLAVHARITAEAGDLFAPFDASVHAGHVDLIVCNPPYISHEHVAAMPAEIAEHEPSLAFDGGPLGVDILLRLVREAPAVLRPGGWLAFEVGLGQGRWALHRIERSGAFADIRTLTDADGQVRALVTQTVRG